MTVTVSNTKGADDHSDFDANKELSLFFCLSSLFLTNNEIFFSHFVHCSVFTTILPFLTTLSKTNTHAHTHTRTYSAHTPDNSFMGFVSEELNETEKRSIQQNKVNNMAVVYGKEASMWKVVYTMLNKYKTKNVHR